MATTTNDQQQRGKPKPPGTRLKHGGTRTGYFYGCRCKACVKAEADYQRKRRQAKKAATTTAEG
jgi:hypothetical protein